MRSKAILQQSIRKLLLLQIKQSRLFPAEWDR